MSAGVSVLRLAAASLSARRVTAALTALTIALSVLLFIGVEKTRTGVRQSFENTISGADLIVGARTSPTNLLLYSIFHIGYASNAVSWETYEAVAESPEIAWTIPIALGDSHRGYRVLGTTSDLYEHYLYADKRALGFDVGTAFASDHDAVLGAMVAADLGYVVGDRIVLAHGAGEVSFAEHDDHPFTVVGILKPTGTPLDRTVQVSLEGVEAMHEGWESGVRRPAAIRASAESAADAREVAHDHEGHDHEGHDHDREEVAHDHDEEGHDHEDGDDHDDGHDHDKEGHDHDHLEPGQVTAFIVGLNSRAAAPRVARALNTFEGEPLTAVIPGLALAELWSVVGVAERALAAIALFTVAIGLVMVLTGVYASLNERRREMAVLRALGARPSDVFGLMVSEAALLAFLGGALGLAAFYGLFAVFGPVLSARAGVQFAALAPGPVDALALAGVVIAAGLLAVLPALSATRRAVADGLSVRY